MIFKADELRMTVDSDEEQRRTRKIFEVLKEKAIKQEKLTELEKDFFCSSVKHSILNDGCFEDYCCCDNYKFKNLYLAYFHDLTGGREYYKLSGLSDYKVETKEAQQDLHYLYAKSDEWDLVVQNVNHKEELLKQISVETRKELKELANLSEFTNHFAKGSNKYIFKKRAIILHSKYIYCVALVYLEKLNPLDLILEINSTKIEFNEYSLVHILSRHFAQIVKTYQTNKSFHNTDFKPQILSIQLKQILIEIDASKLLTGKSIDKIGFQLNGIDYLIYTSEKQKSIKGSKGNIVYRSIDTFFPVSDAKEYNKLISTCELKSIDQTLSIYVPF